MYNMLYAWCVYILARYMHTIPNGINNCNNFQICK